MEKFSSKVHRVHMELGGKLVNSLRIKTQFLEKVQSVSVVDGATHRFTGYAISQNVRLLGCECETCLKL